MPKSLVKKLFLKIFLLFLPFLLIFTYPLLIIMLTDETISVKTAVDFQEGQSVQGLYGVAFSQALSPYYKLLKTQFRKPEILALGTSRVMQFRRNFFLPHTSFYNAGGGVKYLGEYQSFLELLSSSQKPKLLMIGLDQWQFNPNWQPHIFRTYKTQSYLDNNKDNQPTLNILFRNTKIIYRYLLKGIIRHRALWENLIKSDSIGFSAIIRKQGYREDGSFRYGLYAEALREYRHATLSFIERAESGGFWGYAEKPDPERLVILRELLAYCQQNQIHVIGFLPPFSPDGFKVIKEKGQGYAYMGEIYPAIAPIFAEYGFTLADFTDPASLDPQATDDEFIDGFHGSEKTYLQIMIQLAQRDKYLAKYVDLNFLGQLLENIKNPLYLFDD